MKMFWRVVVFLSVMFGFLNSKTKSIMYHPVYNVILAVDNSGSMDDSVWARRTGKPLSDPKGIRFLASELAVNVLNELQSGDSVSDFNIGVYSFAEDVVNLYPISPLKSWDIVKSVIDSIYHEKDIIRRHPVEEKIITKKKGRKVKTGYTNFHLLLMRVLQDLPRYGDDTLIVHNGLILITDGAISGISNREVIKYFDREGERLSDVEVRRLKYEMIKDLVFRLRNRGIKLFVILIGKSTLRDTARWRYYAYEITGGRAFHLKTVDSLLNYLFESYVDFLPISHFDVPKIGTHHKFSRYRQVVVDSFVLDSTRYPYMDELKFMLFVSSISMIDSLHLITPSGMVYSSTSNNSDHIKIRSYRYTKAITVDEPEYGKWKLKIWNSSGKNEEVYVNVHLLIRYPYLTLLEPDFTHAHPEKTKMVFKGIFLSKNGLFLINKDNEILKHLLPEIYIYKFSPKKFIFGGTLKYRDGYFYSDSVSFPETGVYLVKTLTYYLPDPGNARKKLRMGNETSNLIFISKIPKILKLTKKTDIILNAGNRISLEFKVVDKDLADSLEVYVYLQKLKNKNDRMEVNYNFDSSNIVVKLENRSLFPGFAKSGDYSLVINYSGFLKDPNVRSMFNTTIEPYKVHFKLRAIDYIARILYLLIVVIGIAKLISNISFKKSLTIPVGILNVTNSPKSDEKGERIPLDMYGKRVIVGLNTGSLMFQIDEPITCKCFEIFTLKKGVDTKTYLRVLSKKVPIYVDGERVGKGKKKELFDRSTIEIGDYYTLEYLEEKIPAW